MNNTIYQIYYRFFKLCLKTGLIQMRLHTETHDDDMIVAVLEPRWFWKKGSKDLQ